MKAISLPQPWASMAVFGRSEVLNLRFDTRYRGPIFIHAGGVDPRVPESMRHPVDAGDYVNVEDALVGLVTVDGTGRPDEVQLPGARGPWVWSIVGPLVLREPEPYPRFKGLKMLELSNTALDAIVAAAMTPPKWKAAQKPVSVDPGQLGAASRDGWRGD